MIYISGSLIDPKTILSHYPHNSIEVQIIELLSSSNNTYSYYSLNDLEFELNLRKQIVNTSIKLNKSKFSFKNFDESECNLEYWKRTRQGGFLLKKDVKPSDAIKDIFINSSKYGTECATAIVIVYYGALVNVFPEELFNSLFNKIYLMDWEYLDPDLGIKIYENEAVYLPGDCRYFKNPDVNPKTPEWQGENVIQLNNNLYYGHGIGIGTAEEMINELNKNRKDDAHRSAYLLDMAKRLNFKYLSKQYYNATT